MKIVRKFTALLLGSFISLNSFAQQIDTTKLIGTWVCEKIEFLMDLPDTAGIKKDAIGSTVSFLEGNRFLAKSINPDNEESTGTFKLEGKYLIQDGERAEITLLTDKQLVFRLKDALIMHLSRKEKAN
jgi:hypothetical protein